MTEEAGAAWCSDGMVMTAALFLVCLLCAAVAVALVACSMTAEIGEGSLVSYNGSPSDDSLCDLEYEGIVGLRGVIVGRCPYETGNSPGDELWRVRLSDGRQIELWTEEMDVCDESVLTVWARRRLLAVGE